MAGFIRADTTERQVSGDPTDAPTVSATPFTPDEQKLQEYAESQAKEMDALANTITSMIADLPNDPEYDSQRAELAAIKSSVSRAASSLRSGGASMVAIGGMSAAAAQAWAAAKGIDKNIEQQRLEDAADGADITPSSSAVREANSNFLNFSRAHAQSLQDKIDAAGADAAQGVVTLDIMKSQASQLIWDNRQQLAEQSGYAIGSPEYQQFMTQSAEAALLSARGEQREQIAAQLAQANGLQPGTAAYDQFVKPYMDRTVDDKNYQSHYDTAKAALLAKYPDITEAEMKAIESDPKYEGKSFMVILKENPDAAKTIIAEMNKKYGGGEELTNEQIKKLSPDERVAYIKASSLQHAQESMFVQNEQLKAEQQRYEEIRLTIDERVRNGELSRDDAMKLKDQAFDQSMAKRETILNHQLTPAEVDAYMEEKRSDELSIKTQQMISGPQKSNEGHQKAPTLERKAEVEPEKDAKLAQVLAETELHKQKKGLIEYSPEATGKITTASQDLPTTGSIFDNLRDQFRLPEGMVRNVANINVAATDLTHNAAMAEGHDMAKAIAAAKQGGMSLKT